MSKLAKKPTPVVEKRDNVLRGPAPTRRNEVAREMSMRTWGDGKHKNPQDYQRGHARNPKHKGERDDRASEGMTSPTARFEEGVSADPTQNMTPQQAAEWKKQNAIHRDQFTGSEAMRHLAAAWGPTLVAEGQSVPNGVSVKTATHPLDKVRGHDLWPATVARKVPTLYSQEKEEDPTAWVKLFSPYTNAVWYITEYDPSSKEAFGWADLGMGGGELGYISIRELEGLNRRGLPLVERDLYWKPMPLSRAKSSRKASAKKAAQGGHHHVAPNGKVYVDTAFLNSIRGIPGTAVEHMGFGEFYADTPHGRVDFDRMRGVDFPGQSGRSHQMYGEGDSAKWLLQQMISKGHTMTDDESHRTAGKGTPTYKDYVREWKGMKYPESVKGKLLTEKEWSDLMEDDDAESVAARPILRHTEDVGGRKASRDPLVAAWGNLLVASEGSGKVAGGSGAANAAYLKRSPLKDKILRAVAKHYGVSVSEIEKELTDADAEAVYEYIGNDEALQMQVYRDFKAKGFH